MHREVKKKLQGKKRMGYSELATRYLERQVKTNIKIEVEAEIKTKIEIKERNKNKPDDLFSH